MFFGPGKADLLDLIVAEGSIAAAGRRMNMSYKRAWQLVEEMNAMFAVPLVASARGGSGGGGAWLTEAGQAVLAEYRGLQRDLAEAGAARLTALEARLAGTDPQG
ncbi:MAG: LysR family transcriptional regulator [Gemmobacter sp.]|nr:LysR family transcriptional regulator [Gemmobacter sp.]